MEKSITKDESNKSCEYNSKFNELNKQRNYYIDTLKGIAIILVIFIHTAFHSGEAYVPKWIANYTLLFEVPIFFFLSGWAFSYSKNNKSYLKSLIITQIRYMIFMIIIFILIKFTNYLHISNNNINFDALIKWMLYDYSSMKPFLSVEYSLWFFKVYFIVSLIGSVLLKILNKNASKAMILICYISVFIMTFAFKSLGKINIGIEFNYLLFYLFFYMLGNLTKERQFNLTETIITITSLVVLLFLINKITTINVFNIQENKFPPNFVFLIWSSFGVVLVLYFKRFFGNCKENVLSKIGQNSIYVYFAQGIGSSILYYILPYIKIEWYIKLMIMFKINLIITSICIIILKNIIEPIVQKIKVFFEKNVYN